MRIIIITFKKTTAVFGPFALLLIVLLFGVQVDGDVVINVCRYALPIIALVAAVVILIICRSSSIFSKLFVLLLLPLILYTAHVTCNPNVNYINHPYFIRLFEEKPWAAFPIWYVPLIPFSLAMGISARFSKRDNDYELFEYSTVLYSLTFTISVAAGLFALQASMDGTLFMSILMAVIWTLLGGLVLSLFLVIARLPYYLLAKIG